MTLRARSLCFPIILRVFDTTTCYVNTSTETRPIDLRRNGLLRGRVAAFRERERERTLSTWQPFSESSTREPTSVCLHCALDYLPRISIPPIFSSFHLQFLPPFNDLSKQKNGKNLLKLLNPYLNSSNKRQNCIPYLYSLIQRKRAKRKDRKSIRKCAVIGDLNPSGTNTSRQDPYELNNKSCAKVYLYIRAYVCK